MNVKVVEKGKYFDLVSWTRKDLVHYAIRDKSGQQTFETFSPTAQLKGWDLRKHCIQKLRVYDAKGIQKSDCTFRNIVKEAKEVKVGHILVWFNTVNNEYSYSKVVQLSDIFVYYVKPKGFDSCMTFDQLQKLLEKDDVRVIDEGQLPQKIVFPQK